MPDSPPLPNDPASRTPDGTLTNLASTGNPEPPTTTNPTPTPTATTTPTPEPTNDPATDPAAVAKPAVPETYELKASEGKTLDPELLASATPIFKELGLDNAAAQKLVDIWNKAAGDRDSQITSAIQAQGAKWNSEFEADPTLGPHKDQIKLDVGRALEAVLTPAERDAFKLSMDQTMAGNNPAFIKAFWKLSQRAAPGTPVAGGGPSKEGQSPTGQSRPQSAGAAIWPDLPSKTA